MTDVKFIVIFTSNYNLHDEVFPGNDLKKERVIPKNEMYVE